MCYLHLTSLQAHHLNWKKEISQINFLKSIIHQVKTKEITDREGGLNTRS